MACTGTDSTFCGSSATLVANANAACESVPAAEASPTQSTSNSASSFAPFSAGEGTASTASQSTSSAVFFPSFFLPRFGFAAPQRCKKRILSALHKSNLPPSFSYFLNPSLAYYRVLAMPAVLLAETLVDLASSSRIGLAGGVKSTKRADEVVSPSVERRRLAAGHREYIRSFACAQLLVERVPLDLSGILRGAEGSVVHHARLEGWLHAPGDTSRLPQALNSRSSGSVGCGSSERPTSGGASRWASSA